MQTNSRRLGLAELRELVDEDAGLRRLRREVKARLSADPAHDYAHAERVALWALELAPEVPRRQVVAAALLHDIVNLPKDSPRRAEASALSAEAARGLLPDAGFDTLEIDLIGDAILTHSFSRGETPRTDLARALQDADRLEALGVLGLFRVISTGVKLGARYFDASDPFAARRALDDRAFSVDHVFTKLLGLPATMQTEAGRREAELRVATLRQLLVELAREMGVTPPRLEPLARAPGRVPSEPVRTFAEGRRKES
jgi:uncharacterized protein